MSDFEQRNCPLCGKKCEQHTDMDWHVNRCNNCFWFYWNDNITSCLRPQSIEHLSNTELLQRENFLLANKRWNAIYNFLLRQPNHCGQKRRAEFRFAIYKKDEKLSNVEVNVDDLMKDYPKTESEKTYKILENLYFKYKTSLFYLSDLDHGLVYYESDGRQPIVAIENTIHLKELMRLGYISSDKNGCQLTLKGIKAIEEDKMIDKKTEAQQISIAPVFAPTFNNSNIVNINITYEIVCDAIEKSELADEDKTMLNGMIAEIERLVKKKDNKTVWGKIKGALGWIASKAVDVTLAASLVPYLAEIIRGINGL